jgi:hypothetical protein
MRTKCILFLLANMYYKGTNLFLNKLIPVTKGIEGGLYLPSIYGTLYGIGTVLYLGKSVISSGEGAFC